MKKTLFVLVLSLSFVANGLAQMPNKASSTATRAAEGITQAQLRDYLYFVASDEMEGRNTPSRGLDLAAKFIALQLSRWSVKPAGDNGTYFQKFALKRNAPPANPPAEGQAARRFRQFSFDPKEKYDPARMNGDDYATTQNVVAMIEGSDPNLRNEIVAIGAHYDHVGTNPNASGADKIWNGADDDGSGTVAVLSIAEALAKSAKKPRRSVLFVWHAGEERGLWGSEYFTQHPPVDLSRVVTQLNIDMIGRSKKPGYQAPCDINPRQGQKPCNAELSGENEIYVIGSKMMSTQLGDLSEAVNNSYLKLNYNYKYDDPKDPNKFFFRSDHFNYAQKGIPIIFWFDGVHEDYHGAGDSPDKIDYAKMEKITRTIFATMYELADAKSRPTIDKKLPAELTGQ